MEARDRESKIDDGEPPVGSLRAYCQHCDRQELVAPEDIYSPEFNFWCPRCQSILILTNQEGRVLAEDEVERRQAITRVDDEEALPDTLADEQVHPGSLGRPSSPPPPPRTRAGLDSYDAIAAELDSRVFSDARDALRETSSRERPTERMPGEPENPTRAWSENVIFQEDLRATPTVRSKALKVSPDQPTTAWSSRAQDAQAREAATSPDANLQGFRETVRVRRPVVPGRLAQQLTEAISPGLPPLPNWDGGDTQHVKELAASEPVHLDHAPALDESEKKDSEDPLDQIAVVETRRGTGGLGSRTYERQDVSVVPGEPAKKEEGKKDEPAPAPSGASAKPVLAAEKAAEAKPRPKTEDLDWYALIDEALPESQETSSEDPSRVVIRLPETMAPKSEADAEQVRQLQATLEARGLEKQEQRFDPKLLVPAADEREGTGPLVPPENDTRREKNGFPVASDPDAPTRIVAASSVPLVDPTKKPEEEKKDPNVSTAKVETAPRPATKAPLDGPKATRVIENFDRAVLDPGLVCVLDSSSAEADYFKQLYQRIFHSKNGSSPKTVLVTSARRGEGKTTVAANLAVVASRMPGGGALLVEADPRGGDLLRSFGVREKFEGLLEALESRQSAQRYLIPFKLGYALHVLPLGVQGSNAAELISSDRIGEVLWSLRSSHPNAVVIVDGSSVLHAPDPLAIARHVDGVVLVVRADDTPREHVERARDLLGPEKVLGVVLNDAAMAAV